MGNSSYNPFGSDFDDAWNSNVGNTFSSTLQSNRANKSPLKFDFSKKLGSSQPIRKTENGSTSWFQDGINFLGGNNASDITDPGFIKSVGGQTVFDKLSGKEQLDAFNNYNSSPISGAMDYIAPLGKLYFDYQNSKENKRMNDATIAGMNQNLQFAKEDKMLGDKYRSVYA